MNPVTNSSPKTVGIYLNRTAAYRNLLSITYFTRVVSGMNPFITQYDLPEYLKDSILFDNKHRKAVTG